MSLFLLYFEVGRPVPASPVPAALVAVPVTVTFAGRTGPARLAVALTDGLASDHFQQVGSTVAARRGEALRAALTGYAHERLALGARPHLVFLIVEGVLRSCVVDFDHRREVPLAELETALSALARGQVLEVLAEAPGEDQKM